MSENYKQIIILNNYYIVKQTLTSYYIYVQQYGYYYA